MEPNLGAVILCGGESRRMGRPKAWLKLGSQTLLERMVGLVGQAVGAGPMVVVAAPGQELPALPAQVRVTLDSISGQGPLRGLATGLAALPPGTDLVYATGIDTPFLAPGWIPGLVSELNRPLDQAVVPRVGGQLHPLAAVYCLSVVLPVIEALLAAEQFRLGRMVGLLQARILESEALRRFDPELTTLLNLNTPHEYERALADWRQG